jgi:hypothetical protein
MWTKRQSNVERRMYGIDWVEAVPREAAFEMYSGADASVIQAQWYGRKDDGRVKGFVFV